MPAASPVAPAAPSSPRRESALRSLDGVSKRFSMCLLRPVAASYLPRRGSRGSADHTHLSPASGSPSIDGSRLAQRARATIAGDDRRRGGARQRWSERRDELVALVRELVSHASENPKLLGDAAAQARATAAEAACQDAMARASGRARHADRPLRGAAGARRRRRPARGRGRRALADPQRARRRRARGRRRGLAARPLGRRARGRAAVGARRVRHEGRHRGRRRRAAGARARSACGSRATSSSSRSSTRRPAGPARAPRSRAATRPTRPIVLEPTAREIVTVEGGLEWVRGRRARAHGTLAPSATARCTRAGRARRSARSRRRSSCSPPSAELRAPLGACTSCTR